MLEIDALSAGQQIEPSRTFLTLPDTGARHAPERVSVRVYETTVSQRRKAPGIVIGEAIDGAASVVIPGGGSANVALSFPIEKRGLRAFDLELGPLDPNGSLGTIRFTQESGWVMGFIP